MMIENITDLAREVGSRASNLDIKEQDIQVSVRKHTDGDVAISFNPEYVSIQASTCPPHERMFYPFTGDDFWKVVEFIQEEGLEWEEEDEDVYAPRTYHQWRMQEQYD
jgi:hypothetical protein